MLRAAMFALLFTACGGNAKAPATTPVAHEGGEHADAEHGEHGEGHERGESDVMSPEMKQFHDLLHPRAEMPAGPARQKSTCDAIADFKSAADALGKTTPPQSTNADSWTTGTRALVDAVAHLAAECSAGKGFDAAFQKVHDAFHSLRMQNRPRTGSGDSGGGH